VELIETTRAGLTGPLETKVQGLLGEAFFDGAPVDYYARLGIPTAILILVDGPQVVGHLALYRRVVGISDKDVEIGIIGGVAVAPAYRRRGHCRALMESAHAWLRQRGIPFSLLFAFQPDVYASSGYRIMQKQIRFLDGDGAWRTLVYRGGMYAELADRAWPNQPVDLRGPVV